MLCNPGKPDPPAVHTLTACSIDRKDAERSFLPTRMACSWGECRFYIYVS